MATKVALTAEEFRENSQRSIALFNTEKLSTDSTHVLKSAYCNSVHFCRCNLHGACGGKASCAAQRVPSGRCNLHGACGGKVWEMAHRRTRQGLQSARSVWRQSWITCLATWVSIVAICTERVEAKVFVVVRADIQAALQSARCVWRQSTSATSLWTAATVAICTGRAEKPNGIIPPTEKNPRKFMQTYCIFIHLGV